MTTTNGAAQQAPQPRAPAERARQALDRITAAAEDAKYPAYSWSTVARLLNDIIEQVEVVRAAVDQLDGPADGALTAPQDGG